MRKVYVAALALLTTSVVLPINALATSQMQRGGVTASASQVGTCTGTVYDEEGEPLPGASVIVEGETNGVPTDIDGKFVISRLKIGTTLKIAYVGYMPQTVVWDGTPLTVNMVLSTNA